MQLHLSFTGENIRLPMAHQRLVQGMLYAALGRDPAYQSFLHQRGYRMEEKTFRHFVFGRLHGRYEREPDGLCFPEGFSFEVRSAQGRFIQLLLDEMTPGSVHRLGQNRICVAKAELRDCRLVTPEIEIRMDSPITVHTAQEDGSTFFPTPFDPDFSRLLAVNAARKWISLYGTDPPGGLGFAPIAVTERDKVVTRYKGTYLTGWRGTYRLEGEPAVLDLLFQTGLGSNNAQGFGLFNLC